MRTIDRKRLAHDACRGRHPLLMQVLEHRAQTIELTLRACIEQLAALSDAQLADLVVRGVIPLDDEERTAAAEEEWLILADGELFADLDAAVRSARARIKPWQRRVRAGDAVVVEDPDSDLLLFGRVLADPGCPVDEVSARWCSAVCPAGERGDQHRGLLLMRLQGDELAQAAAVGWPETLHDLLALLWPLPGGLWEG
jgi:hypothetical protein